MPQFQPLSWCMSCFVQILEDQLDTAITAGVEVHLVWSGTAADAAASLLEADSIEVVVLEVSHGGCP